MKPILVASLLACMIVTSSQFCHADLIMQFGSGGTIGVSTISAAPGSSLTLDLYLTQQGTYQPVPYLPIFVADYRLSPGHSDRGLGQFFVDIAVRNAANGLSQTGVRPANPSTFVYGTGFSDYFHESGYLDAPGPAPSGNVVPGPTSSARFVGIGTIVDATVTPVYVAEPFPSTLPPSNTGTVQANSVFLGQVTLSIDSAASGSYSIDLSSPDTGRDSYQKTKLGSGLITGYVDVGFSGATLNVSAVPEPGTILLTSLGLGFVAFRRFRKSRSAAKSQ